LDRTGANLIGANLNGATLIGAKLEGATLGGAYFKLANLTKVDLRGANLLRANLRGVDLSSTNGLTRKQIDKKTILPSYLKRGGTRRRSGAEGKEKPPGPK
jgi:uncharacterized protein YjbI with pentapeptide repeats